MGHGKSAVVPQAEEMLPERQWQRSSASVRKALFQQGWTES